MSLAGADLANGPPLAASAVYLVYAATMLCTMAVRSDRSDCMRCLPAGNAKFLTADDVTFAVLVRGYGSCQPPDWSAISLLLNTMEQQYQCKPGIGGQYRGAYVQLCAMKQTKAPYQ